MEPLISFLLFLFGAYFFYRLGRFVERRLWLNAVPIMNKVKTKQHNYEHSQN